jgi:hypothetical protein
MPDQAAAKQSHSAHALQSCSLSCSGLQLTSVLELLAHTLTLVFCTGRSRFRTDRLSACDTGEGNRQGAPYIYRQCPEHDPVLGVLCCLQVT